jgi:microcystin-dependent protein
MSQVTLQGNASGTGIFTLAAPNSNTNRTLNLPDAGGTLIATGSAELVPVGAVIHVAMNTAPTGWLKANGAAVSRTTYAALFAAIGTTFGAGDGSTTFLLPDLRGEFLRGWDDGRGVDSGRSFGTAQLDQMQRITGEFEPEFHFRNAVRVVGAFTSANTATYSGQSGSGGSSKTIVFNSANSPGARVSDTTSGETRARNVALLACIKF